MQCNLDVNNVITSEHHGLMSKIKAAVESKHERTVLCSVDEDSYGLQMMDQIRDKLVIAFKCSLILSN